ncbi:MAG: hypothetical protein JWN78_1385, partial [Bacteroidota bacterium]|nr:hypothetical protein [Bacteroidota bacterium]
MLIRLTLLMSLLEIYSTNQRTMKKTLLIMI